MVSVSYKFTPELTGKINVGYDTSESSRHSSLAGTVVGLTNGTSGNGRGSLNDINADNKLLEATLNYKKDFGNSSIDAIVGFSYQSFARDGRNVQVGVLQHKT